LRTGTKYNSHVSKIVLASPPDAYVVKNYKKGYDYNENLQEQLVDILH
jgi:hypothetical protein